MEILDPWWHYLIGIVFGSLLSTYFYWEDSGRYRWTRKRITLPCPACRDDNDKPTGVVTPDNPWLQRVSTTDGELPSFTCATCDGKKKVTYEYKKGERVRINERQMVEGGVEPRQIKKQRRK